jgi:hypothetical protein
MKKLLALAAIIGGLLATLAGCSSTPVTYAPAAYGIAGQCYYVQNPAEAVALEAAGLCPSGWVPTLMPLAWHEEYYSYYDSPVYYSRYVPAGSRTVYVSRQKSFGTTYKTRISTLSKTATYKGSNGSTVKGTKVAKAKFGSGTSGTSLGGGSRGKTSGKTSTSGKSGSKSGSSGFGGGSRSSGSHSSSHSGSHH